MAFQNNPYDFISEELEEGNVYLFYTNLNKLYTVYFDPSEYADYLDKFPFLLSHGFGFGFYFEQISEKTKKGNDDRVLPTIFEIGLDFLNENPTNTILLYHCDSKDKRQTYRHELFEDWYKALPPEKVYMHSIEVKIAQPDGELISHYLGFITNASNPNIEKAILELEDFAMDLIKIKSSK
ncbi:hypothetical protein SAMN05518672_103133 [Chitinophaga sp. CF118]|uniref:DUF6169 family protein n=1 Tax=Chitinophaga sp. CF118 TaxID=1884367 RepID=UPI0008E17152|nr:DUF6169 family protein [Chitinophaga sp. CF118]SFD76602.1 hypothetical protein SAMN05518672_103133 [Chitinophaga sp. CF118]